MINVSGVNFSYNSKKTILKSVDKKFLSGKIYGVVGPNGAGKTTLLNIISGINMPRGGSVEVDGFNIVKNRMDALMRVGFMPDSLYLDYEKPVLEQLVYFGTFYNMTFKESTERVTKLLTLFGLPSEFWKKPVKSLSLGQKRRVGLTMATVHDPDNIIMDEPYNGFDPFGMKTLTDFVLEERDKGKTIIISSHILKEIQAIADEFVYIEYGKLLASRETADIEKTAGKIWVRVVNPDDSLMSILAKFGTVRRIGPEYEISPDPQNPVETWDINSTLVSEKYQVQSIRQDKRTIEDEFFSKKDS